jgi:hypothetical protein
MRSQTQDARRGTVRPVERGWRVVRHRGHASARGRVPSFSVPPARLRELDARACGEWSPRLSRLCLRRCRI